MTPLIRVLTGLGFEVDALIAPDYLDTVKLLEGAPEINSLYYIPSSWCSETPRQIEGLSSSYYDIATFTVWSSSLRSLVRTKRVFSFSQQEWISAGDTYCVQKIARAVGWQEALPPPFAVASQRQFGLAPGTVALHPGCKPGWPWKKWHGFEDLARLLPEVVVIGTPVDLDNRSTYFARNFEWPDHVRDFTGQLSLHDSAALLSECAALVSNDSGLMHLGAALGVPTFGIFGLTSPEREAMACSNMSAITKGLTCEPACRRRPWGRRDCEYHLECLKSLTAQEVRERLIAVLRPVGQHTRPCVDCKHGGTGAH